MTLIDRFDEWVERGPFTAADLGLYRIVYAVGALLIAPDIAWLGRYPNFMFHAPPGPLQLLSGFPPPAVLIALEILRTVALVVLGLGLWTRWASLATWFLLTLTYGLTYCLGKVDHTILVTLVPLVLTFANWGERFSLDSLRHQRDSPPQRHQCDWPPQRQWPLRLLALLIAWPFFAAAITKIITGWLAFGSQAARGYFVLGFVTEDRTHWLAGWVAAHDVRAVWELVDWATVAFELSLLIALAWWRAFRVALAVAAGFHLGVLLVMDIDFSHAVIAYGAFVSWGSLAARVGLPRCHQRATALLRDHWATTTLVATTCAVLWCSAFRPEVRAHVASVAGFAIVFAGAAVGLSYLISNVPITRRREPRPPRRHVRAPWRMPRTTSPPPPRAG